MLAPFPCPQANVDEGESAAKESFLPQPHQEVINTLDYCI